MPARRLRPCGLPLRTWPVSHMVVRVTVVCPVAGHASPISCGRCSATCSRSLATWPGPLFAGCDPGSAHGICALRSLAPGSRSGGVLSTGRWPTCCYSAGMRLDGFGSRGRWPRSCFTHRGAHRPMIRQAQLLGLELRGQGASRSRSSGPGCGTHYCPGLSLFQVRGCRLARRWRSRSRRRPSGAGAHTRRPLSAHGIRGL